MLVSVPYDSLQPRRDTQGTVFYWSELWGNPPDVAPCALHANALPHHDSLGNIFMWDDACGAPPDPSPLGGRLQNLAGTSDSYIIPDQSWAQQGPTPYPMPGAPINTQQGRPHGSSFGVPAPVSNLPPSFIASTFTPPAAAPAGATSSPPGGATSNTGPAGGGGGGFTPPVFNLPGLTPGGGISSVPLPPPPLGPAKPPVVAPPAVLPGTPGQVPQGSINPDGSTVSAAPITDDAPSTFKQVLTAIGLTSPLWGAVLLLRRR